MVITSWSVRGYNDPTKCGFVQSHVAQHRIDIKALLETRAKKGKEAVILREWKSWKHQKNLAEARNGRIMLFWRAHARMSVLKKTNQLLHCAVHSVLAEQIYLTFIYASNSVDERSHLWNDLRAIGHNMQSPWCLLGPFKYYNHWSSHSQFKHIVRKVWSLMLRGSPMSVLFQKL